MGVRVLRRVRKVERTVLEMVRYHVSTLGMKMMLGETNVATTRWMMLGLRWRSSANS